MKPRSILISCLVLLVAACGGGSSTSNEARTKQINFVGTQTITLSNDDISANETDNFTLAVNGQVLTVVDEDFSATGLLNTEKQFVVSSPIFSTTSENVTCTGSITYSGQVSGSSTSGNIQGEFSCSGVVFNVSGEFLANR